MSRRSRRQRDVGLTKGHVVRARLKTLSQDGEQHISLRTYVYNEELPLPIVIRKPIKPRPIDSDESGEELEDIYPAPICISCSGVDNDPLVWCSGCGDPYHTDCAPGYPKREIGKVYRWLCQFCRQTCVSCSDSISTQTQTFKCKSCWRIIHRKCVDPSLRNDYRQNGWQCSFCQRVDFLEPPQTICSSCDSLPIKHCPSQYSCKRCQASISSCCLSISSSVLQFKDFMKLPYLCLSCDPAQNWKRQLECSWRRKLLILLGDVQKLESIEKEKLENLKNKLDTIEHLDQLDDELSKVYSKGISSISRTKTLTIPLFQKHSPKLETQNL